MLLLLLLLLTGTDLGTPQSQNELTPEIHYGTCFTSAFGGGRCIRRRDCDFYDLSILDGASHRHCHSQLKSDLICCPREKNALPLLAPRMVNSSKLERPNPSIGGQYSSAVDELPKHPYCGSTFGAKVHGGNITGLQEFPWTTLLEYTVLPHGDKVHLCGASFIAQRWLLTAAHCLHERFLGDKRKLTGARLGEWNKTSNPDCIVEYWNDNQVCSPPYIQATIDLALIHPQFEVKNYTHDIALLRLEEPVDWRPLDHVMPICLPPTRGPDADQLVGSAADVSGWGLTEQKRASDVKRKAKLIIQPQDMCVQEYRKHNFVLNGGQMCASGGKGIDSCSGDSGGPLTVETYTPQRDAYVYLAGIVSFGREYCGLTDFPAIYTRVSSYMDWIEETIRNNTFVVSHPQLH